MKDVLYDWNHWWTSPDKAVELSGTRREGYNAWMQQQMKTKHVISIAGIRRSGKTTIMYQAIAHLLKTVPPEDILLINADDERLVMLKDPLESLIKEYFRTVKKDMGNRTYVFLDEVQNFEGWERFVKRNFDLGKDMKFIVSGSSSSLISSDYSNLLTGRCMTLRVAPLSFKEFLSFRSEMFTSSDLEGTWTKNRAKEDQIIRHLDEYMSSGGFPEIVLGQGGHELLGEYFKAIIYRDLVTRYQIREPRALELLAVYALRNFSNLLSTRSIAQAAGLSPDTAADYLSYMENAFLLHVSRRFAHSTKAQMNTRNPMKTYATDIGMASSLMLEPMETKGRVAENIVANELMARYRDVMHWRGDLEVDIIVPSERLSFQVCYGPVRENEVKAFDEAPLRGYQKFIVTVDEYDPEEGITKVPLWTLLLSEGIR